MTTGLRPGTKAAPRRRKKKIIVESEPELILPDPYENRFRLVSGSELAKEPEPMEWDIEGVWPHASYGVLGGKKKTLKTYNLLAMALALASGEPFLGHFAVPEPRPVVMYLAEGGKAPTQRRLHRIAQWMEVDVEDIPLYMAFDSDQADSPVFKDRLRENLEGAEAGLFIMDPLYAFHPANIEAQNLYERGRMLADIQRLMPEGCGLLVADHFRKTGVQGNDLDLDSIAQSGMAQWADSWVLQTHREKPEVDKGEFKLGVEFGSRQWGGGRWAVDWHIGSFDIATGEHDGELSVEVNRMDWDALSKKSEEMREQIDGPKVREILALLEAEPDIHTKDRLLERLSLKTTAGRRIFRELEDTGHIQAKKIKGEENGRLVSRDRYSIAPASTRIVRVQPGLDGKRVA